MAASTELQAVNVMLQTLGESTTTTLSGTLPFEVNAAQLTLAEVSKGVQQEGFTFNTQFNRTVITGSDGVISSTILHVYDAANSKVYSVRGDVLWSVTDNALEDDDIAMTVVKELGFTSVPEVARRYITIRAARIFADRFVGSTAIREFTERDEAEAKAQLHHDYGIKKEGVKEAKDAQYDAALSKLVEDKKASDDKVLTFDSTVTEKKISVEEAQLAADILRHATGATELDPKTLAADKQEQTTRLRELESKAAQSDSTLDGSILASSKKEVADKDKTFDSNVTDKTLELEEDRLLAEIARRAGTLDADALAADIKEIEANRKEYIKLLARRDSTLDADTLDADLLDAQSHKIRAEIMNMDMEAKLAEDYEVRGSGVNESMINGSLSVSSILNRRP